MTKRRYEYRAFDFCHIVIDSYIKAKKVYFFLSKKSAFIYLCLKGADKMTKIGNAYKQEVFNVWKWKKQFRQN